MKYKISQYAKKNNVTIRTVWNWIKNGDVVTEKTKTGGWLIIENEETKNERVFIYARDDLMQDFVSIITSFTARLYGQRRTKRKAEKLIEILENEVS